MLIDKREHRVLLLLIKGLWHYVIIFTVMLLMLKTMLKTMLKRNKG